MAWTLEVRASNTAAQELYRQFGFAPAGVRKRYYENTEDAIVMWCHDIQSDGLRRAPAIDRGAGDERGTDATVTVDASTVVLGIETSCDETAAALVMGGNDVISSVVSSQIEIHADFGGVVPEIASRAHLEALNPVVARAIVEAGDRRAADRRRRLHLRPGPDRRPAGRRVGGQGVGAGVGRAVRRRQPPRGASATRRSSRIPTLEFPLVVLLVSGGHTMLIEMQDHGRYRMLGQTIDDAAGEAFDKVARFLEPRLSGRAGDRRRRAQRRSRRRCASRGR